MSSPPLKLTTTSYAILGMVGLRSYTTYELSKAMQRSFDYFWPRARSLVYAEVKRLAELGLLAADKNYVGRRARTTYSITPEGRAALSAWLSTPPQAFALEMEGLLRLYLAGLGTRDDLILSLETMRDEAATMRTIAADFQRSYLAETAPFMDQVHLRALLNDYLANFAEFTYQWAIRSLSTVSDWDDLSPEGKKAAALETIAGLPPFDHPPE